MIILYNGNFPVLNQNYKVHLGPIYSFVVDVRNNKEFVLNKDASLIIDQCEGLNSIEQIAQNLSELVDDDYKTILEDITNYLQYESFIDILENPQDIKINKTGNWISQTPMHISVELTDNYNFLCKHCYSESSFKKSSFIPKDHLINAFKTLNEFGVEIVELTGGDPLLHPDFISILKNSLDIFKFVGVITNRFLVNKMIDESIDTLIKHHNKLFFQIDIHGCEEAYVDWFCGKKGAFDAAQNAVSIISELGINCRVAMSVTPLNVKQIFETAQLAKNKGATSIIYSPVVPMGRGENDELIFSRKQFESALKEIELAYQEFGDFIFKCPEYKGKLMVNCGAGSRSWCISPKGDIKICPMESNQNSFGNIFHDTDILKKNFGLFFLKLKEPNFDICNTCDDLLYCQGCLARGMQKYQEKKEDCVWGNENLSDILNKDKG